VDYIHRTMKTIPDWYVKHTDGLELLAGSFFYFRGSRLLPQHEPREMLHYCASVTDCAVEEWTIDHKHLSDWQCRSCGAKLPATYGCYVRP
jgi:hypothetical protein